MMKYKKLNFIVSFFYRLVGFSFVLSAFLKSFAVWRIEKVFLFLGFQGFLSEIFSLLLIFFELILGTMILFLIYDKVVTKIASITLIFFSIVLIYLLFQKNSPSCACYGFLELFYNFLNNKIFGLFRNTLFILIIFYYYTYFVKNK